MPEALPNCLCPLDSSVQKLAKINNNLALLFTTMASGDWTGNLVTLVGNGCGCTETQILAAMNQNIASFFAYLVENPIGGGTGQAGVEDLALNDVAKAITFPTAFSAAPAVVAVVIAPDNTGFVISASPDESTRTTTGVTILFGAAIPAAGYKLAWVAQEESV